MERDREATPGLLAPDPLRSTWADEQQSLDAAYAAIDDRRALLGLLREAKRALDSVGNCHGCIDTEDHVEERALLDRLLVLGRGR